MKSNVGSCVGELVISVSNSVGANVGYSVTTAAMVGKMEGNSVKSLPDMEGVKVGFSVNSVPA